MTALLEARGIRKVFATFLEFDLSLPWPWAPTAPLSRLHLGGLTFTVLDLAMVYFIVAGQLTALARARGTYRALPRTEPAARDPPAESPSTSTGRPPFQR